MYRSKCHEWIKKYNITIFFIGFWSKRTQKQWSSKYKNLDFLGFVENLHNCLSGSISIVPITIGSGIRMKILEAVMMGIPFVSIEVGVDGLPFRDSEDCFICNEAADFAHKILMLKNDFALQQQFVKSANEKIKTSFSPEKLK